MYVTKLCYLLIVLATDDATSSFSSLLWLAGVAAVIIILGGLYMWISDKINPPEMPNSAVVELLDLCIHGNDPDEWAVVRFPPSKSLEEARAQVGESYTDEDRVLSFMRKFDIMAPVNPDVAVFLSSQKGIATGNVSAVKALVQKHGKWKLNRWRCLAGALQMAGMRAHSLDGPQSFVL